MKKTKSHKKNGPKPERIQAFEEYFSSIYKDRWPSLRAALLREPRHEKLRNPFGPQYSDYSLDAASVLAARNLGSLPGDRTADFCSSPGGKALTLIFATHGEGEWHLNDLSPNRVQRLKAVLYDCLPETLMSKLQISRSDASRWGLNRAGVYDRILVDAPCSGERHLLSTPNELARWSIKGAKRLAIRQHALLCSALDCLKPGGRLVYSTCSINPMENDGVIEKLSKSRLGRFKIVEVHEEIGEATRYGWIVLPDKTGCGPIFFCVLEALPAV